MKNSEAIRNGKRTTFKRTVSEELLEFWEKKRDNTNRGRMDLPWTTRSGVVTIAGTMSNIMLSGNFFGIGGFATSGEAIMIRDSQ